jgi:hypothetical protein
MFFKIARKLFTGSGEKVNFVFGTPICFACLIESYWKVIQAIFKILLESFKCDIIEISYKYYFSDIFLT